MQHCVDHNDILAAREKGYCPVGFFPSPVSGKITPHVTKLLLDDGRYLSVIHAKPIYYLSIFDTWRPMSEVCSHYGNKRITLKYNKLELIHPEYLAWLSKRQGAIGGTLSIESSYDQHAVTLTETSLSFTTSTFYPDPHTETSSVDGHNYITTNGAGISHTFAAAHSYTGTSTNPDDTSTTITAAWIGRTFSGFIIISRGYVGFDTSSISTDTIDSASISWTLQNHVHNQGVGTAYDYIGFTRAFLASDTAIGTGDYDATDFTEVTDSGERVTFTALVNSTTYTYDLNATGIAHIDKAGGTHFGILNGHDLQNQDPSMPANNQSTYALIYSADQSGTSSDPYLTVIHSAGGGGGATDNALAFCSF